nr:hypothetical protein [Tanacetum cinerariifolium]
KVTDLAASVKVREQELADLDAVVTSVMLQNDSLVDQVHKLEVASSGFQKKLSHYENLTERLEEFQDAQLKVVNDKLEKLYADFVDMALHFEEKFYPHLLTIIFGLRWLLTHGMELAITNGVRTVVDPDSNLQRVYVPHWNVTNGFCMDDGGVCREMLVRFLLGVEVRMRAEYNIKEKMRLNSVVEEKDSLLKSRCDEIEILKIQLLIKEAKAVEAVRLRDEAQALKERNTYLEKEKSELEIKVTDLAASVKVRAEAEIDFVVRTYVPIMTNTTTATPITDPAAIVKEKLDSASVFGGDSSSASESHPIFGGFSDPTGGDFLPMVPIHHSLDGDVVGATSLSFALDVSDAWVRKIRENIASQMPALHDVFTSISEPFSAKVLTGTGCTSDTVHAPVTTALSVTSVSASTILPISTDDYEIAHTEGGEEAVADVEAVADEGADPFPDVSGVELDISK